MAYAVKDCRDDFGLLCEAGGPLELLADHVRDGDPDGIYADGAVFDNQVLTRLREVPAGENGHLTQDPDGTLCVWFHDDSGSSEPVGFEVVQY